jgi:DEAD/DEAH box helicase domain-containing protein
VSLVESHLQTAVQGGNISEGEVQVTRQVVGFRKIKWYTHETLGSGEIDLPPTDLQTTAYWIAISEKTVETLRDQGLWTNSPNDYGPGWASLRAQVRARDGYRCQVCGIAEMGREHDVHHKSPFRSFHNPELANQLSNLITLCPSCHRKVETAVHIRSGLAGLGYVLGQLAPLFLMCDTRDLGVHSDPEAAFADGRPTVMVYDQVPAGIGFSAKLYELHDQIVRQAHELVSACPCTDGCPSCVGPGGENGSGGKAETLALLKELVVPGFSRQNDI